MRTDKEDRDVEERLVELEMKVAFQDDTLVTLNDIVVQQAREIEQLRRTLDALQTQLNTLTPQQARYAE